MLSILRTAVLLAALGASPPSVPYTQGVYTLQPANGDMSQTTVTAVPTPNGPGDNHLKKNTLVVASWTGSSPAGSLQLYGSADAVNYVPLGTAQAVSGNSGSAAWDVVGTGALWLSVVYTKTSGTGTLVVTESSKAE